MRRRLDLALSLIHEPSVLFLDEPTTGLDPTSRLALWDEVRRLNAEGTTVFLTTQYLEEADELAGRVAIIDGGKIVREGAPTVHPPELGLEVVAPDGHDDDVGAGELGLEPALEPLAARQPVRGRRAGLGQVHDLEPRCFAGELGREQVGVGRRRRHGEAVADEDDSLSALERLLEPARR
jgi:energy-coupling factor transporter ATP-binding protein EcfA2